MMGFNLRSRQPGYAASEEEIVAFVDQVKAGRGGADRLVPFLHYAHPIYNSRSRNATLRLRGWILEAFLYTGLPDAAVSVVLDELESSTSPFVVAASARALRGFDSPSAAFAPFLLKAIKNIRLIDDYMTFKVYKPQWPLEESTTAVREILMTFRWLGHQTQEIFPQLMALEQDPYFSEANKRALRETLIDIERSPVREDCCSIMTFGTAKKIGNFKKMKISQVVVEDHDNRIIGYDELFSGSVSVLLLFYTRCDNTNRCSRNVTRLGKLQQLLREKVPSSRVRLVALTYDPEYDFSFRTKPYCTNRGLMPGDDCRVGRVVNGMDTLLEYLGAGVSYNEGLLNSHTTDLYVLDEMGRVVRRVPGIEWDNEILAGELEAQQLRKVTNGGWSSSVMSVVVSTLLVFFPKCPFCVAAYLSMLGITQIEFFAVRSWMIPFLGVMLVINLGALFWMAWKRKWFLPFYLSCVGAAMAVVSSVGIGGFTFPAYIWLVLMAAGSLLNGVPGGFMRKVRLPKLPLYHIGTQADKTTL